jgi:hypothetical protein
MNTAPTTRNPNKAKSTVDDQDPRALDTVLVGGGTNDAVGIGADGIGIVWVVTPMLVSLAAADEVFQPWSWAVMVVETGPTTTPPVPTTSVAFAEMYGGRLVFGGRETVQVDAEEFRAP